MPELLDTIRQDINARLEELRPLAREASDLQRALDALNGMLAAPTGDGGSRRRRKEGQASPRTRSPRGDVRTRVIEFVASNPGSTAGDVARALGLNRNSVATRLAQLAKAGELAKAERGYAIPTGPR
ncbi:MAG: winged helix-turn-helix transcriptional regulator [Solirubrobacteraceae bacterium]